MDERAWTEADGATRDRIFTAWVEEALGAMPAEIAAAVTNVAILIEDEAPGHPSRLGLYEGVPLPRRGNHLPLMPDRITLYRGTLERFYGRDPVVLKQRVQHVVRHELAHHFGISDDRLREIGRY